MEKLAAGLPCWFLLASPAAVSLNFSPIGDTIVTRSLAGKPTNYMKAHFPFLLLCTAILGLVTSRGSAQADFPYHKEIRTKNSHGELVDIEVTELRQDARTSTLAVNASEAALGSSVGEPGFILSCCYELAKIRRAAYLIVLQEEVADDPRKSQYLIGFSPDPHVDPIIYFGLKEPLSKERNMFLSVEDHEALLRKHLPRRFNAD